jgi:predicted metalloendopeptidase
MELNNFFDFSNYNYLQQKIPHDETTVNNFMDIQNNNTKQLIDLFDNLKDNSLMKTLYDKKLNFPNMDLSEQTQIYNQIIKMINDVSSKKTLIEKIRFLNMHDIAILLAYNISKNPKNNSDMPYVISIDIPDLSFDKEYYFDKKYVRELDGFKKYIKDLLLLFKNDDIDIDQVCNDVFDLEKEISPYILSNVFKRDVRERVNSYNLKEINSKFKNLDLLHECFLKEYNILDAKENYDILFSNNLDKCSVHSSDYLDDKDKYDNGDYYWYFLDNLFKKYKNDKTIRRKIDNYIIWCIIDKYASFINEDFRILKFKFYGTFLSGQMKEKSLKERAIQYVKSYVPELVGKLYCDNYFDKDHHLLMMELTKYLLVTYKNNFKNKCDWLTNKSSLKEALRKIEVLKTDENLKIGCPEEDSYKLNLLLIILHIQLLHLLHMRDTQSIQELLL